MVVRDPSSSKGSSDRIPSWFMAPSFASETAYESFSSLITPSKVDSAQTLVCQEDIDPARDGEFAGTFDFATLSVSDVWTLGLLSDIDVGQSLAQTEGGSTSTGSQAEDVYVTVSSNSVLRHTSD